MKRSELAFNIASIPTDAIMLLMAGLASFYLRQKSTNIVGPILYQLKLPEFLPIAFKLIPILILIFAVLGLYNLRGTRKFFHEFGRVIIGISLGLLFVILLFFFDQTIFPSRFIILAAWALGIIFVSFGRFILKICQEFAFAQNIGLHRLVLIMDLKSNLNIIEDYFKNKAYGYKIVKEINFDSNTINELENLKEKNQIDEILQTNSSLKNEDNLKLVEFARNNGLEYSFVPDLFNVQRNVIESYTINGVPVIMLKNTPLGGWGKVVKRFFDIIAAIICLIATLPFFIFVALGIKIDSPGKIIYSAFRAGRNKNFKFYKFRTMYSHMSVGEKYGGQEAEKLRQELWKQNTRGGEKGPFLKIKKDPRVTQFGRLLRHTKLDEIPQFWNVFTGNMSMVGPRAHVLDEVERYKKRYPRMFSIKPGIFGLSQIAQFNWQDLPFEEEIRLNTYYIENWSLWLDVKILIKSFWIIFFANKQKEDF